MTADRIGLNRLMLRQPVWRRTLTRSFARSGEVREICENYQTAWIAFAHWAARDDDIAPALAAEYRSMIAELEAELEALIEP